MNLALIFLSSVALLAVSKSESTTSLKEQKFDADDFNQLKQLFLELKKENAILLERVEKMETNQKNIKKENAILLERVEKMETNQKKIKKENAILLERVEKMETNQKNKKYENQLTQTSQQLNYTVSFTAYVSESTFYGPNVPVLFDVVIHNYGDFYNPATGTFVCPQTAYYFFTIHVTATYDKYFYGELTVDDTGLVLAYGQDSDQGSNSILTMCNIGQQVFVKSRGGSPSHEIFGDSNFAWSTFTGILLFSV